MKKQQNTSAKTLVLLDGKDLRLDRYIKTIMVQKPILACILKETVAECQSMTIEEIMDCIAPNPIITRCGSKEAKAALKALQLSQENLTADGEHSIFDILTVLFIPGNDPIKIFLNIELQKNDKPGYDIPTRGIFHCARIISSQLGTEFTNHPDDKRQYADIKKTYSIWICSETAEKRANSVDEYKIERKTIIGENTDNPYYDIMSVMVVNIGKNYDPQGTDSNMLSMLNTLFDRKIDAQEKIGKFSDLGLPMTTEVETEVSGMCKYTSKTLEIGREEGREEGRMEMLFSLAQKGSISVAEGADEANMSIPEFLDIMHKKGYTVPQNV